jgi:hypothetical protein
MPNRLEEVLIPRPEETKRLVRAAQERPEQPAHLRADQAENDNPAAEHRFDLRA